MRAGGGHGWQASGVAVMRTAGMCPISWRITSTALGPVPSSKAMSEVMKSCFRYLAALIASASVFRKGERLFPHTPPAKSAGRGPLGFHPRL